MATATVEINELATRFDEMLSLAAAGAEIIVTEAQTPRARLIPLPSTEASPARVVGLHAGAIQCSADFDAPLPDEFWTGAP